MNLDPQQKSAVETQSTRALVLAGAGSGKTRTMIERIAWLVETQKVSPYEILSFSFTRKAAGEIGTRLEERIGAQAHHCTLGTMHSIALKLIKRFGEIIGTKTHGVTIYSEWETQYLLKVIAQDMGIYKKSWKIPKKEIDKVFSDYYERGQDPPEHHPAYKLFKAFIQACKENNALSYGALLVGMKMLLPNVAQYLHYRHILVDEVQDIDPLQWSIINMLCELTGAALFVVGDLDQSIYAFRGAVPEYLLEHEKEFDIYRLETNYRSDANIVKAANSLIRNNLSRFEKEMRPFEDPQTPIETLKNCDSAAIVGLIYELKKKAPMVKRAVLSRIHGLLQKVSRMLTEKGIDHAYIGGKTALTNSEEFRRFHAFLKLIVNPYDNFSFLLIRDLIGLSPVEYQAIRTKAVAEGKSHFQVWIEHASENNFMKLVVTEKWDLSDTVENIASVLEQDPFPGLKEITDFILSAQVDKAGSVEDYLDWVSLFDIQDELSADKHDIQLMTVHAAKGLEFPTVIIAGANEGFFPHSRSTKDLDQMEEERRLMYVAVTRAEDRLILAVRPEQSEDFNSNIKYTPASRFIKEMSL